MHASARRGIASFFGGADRTDPRCVSLVCDTLSWIAFEAEVPRGATRSSDTRSRGRLSQQCVLVSARVRAFVVAHSL